MSGEPLDFSGEFFELDAATIRPAVEPRVPLIIGGRSDAALERTARYGDGWIGVWCSPHRYAEAVSMIDERAQAAGRDVRWYHGYQPWVGVADTREKARELVANAMERFYRVPFKAFEKYTPYSRPDEVAAQLAPYADAGARLMNLKIVAASDAEEVTAATEIRRRMLGG